MHDAPSMKKVALFFTVFWSFVTAAPAQRLPSLIPYFDGSKWGYADSNGRVRIKPQWASADFFSNGRAKVYVNGSTCIIDTHGTYIIPPYRRWTGKFYTSLIGAYYNASGKNGKLGIIDSNNHEIIPCLYERSEPGNGFTSSGTFMLDKHQGKYAAKAMKNGKLGIIDTLNHTLIPFEYDGIDMDGYPFSSAKYYVVEKGKHCGVIDARNRTIIPVKYRNIWLDELNDNQIMVFRERTTAIADTNGNIILEVPGYTLGFPRGSLFSVRDSAGKYGIMNYDRKLVIPCEYLTVWLQHDTIVVSKWFTDSVQVKRQIFKYYSIHNFQEISDWIDYAQITKQLPPKAPPLLNKYLPYLIKLYINGHELDEYQKGNITWSATDYGRRPERFAPVRGIAAGDSIARYAAIIDTNGDYVIAPMITESKLAVTNAADSLLIVENTNKDSFQAIADFHLNIALPFQPYAIHHAFYHNHIFYAVVSHDKEYTVPSNSLDESVSSQQYDYTYYLITAEGKLANGTEHYTLDCYTDSIGRPTGEWSYYSSMRGEGFTNPFLGYFMVTDSSGKKGIVDIYGKVLLPDLSFKYYQLTALGGDVFLVDNIAPNPRRYYVDRISLFAKSNKEGKKGLLRGMPYLVNRHNKVLLDSLSVESAGLISRPGAAALYRVLLKRPANDYSAKYIEFYMNSTGKAYFSNLPGDKKRRKP